MAAWDPGAVYLVLASVLGIIILIVSLLSRGDDKGKKKGQRAAGQGNQEQEAAGVRRRRNRMQVGRRVHDEDDEEEVSFEEEDDDASFGLMDQPTGKIGAKKLKRLEMKAEKRAMREQMEAEREDKKRRDELREQERIKDEARRKKEQERLEVEERLRKEEQERKEHEEYLLLKESFVVEDEGVGETEEESRALLQEFVDYIKKNKVVLLEDLACEFGLRTQDAIDRLQLLQEMERITGVTDDRGKFIYISPEELEAVAKFIKQRGRVTISELAESSNQLINLQTEKLLDTRSTGEAASA